MSENIELVESIPDQKPVRVFIPVKNSPERYRTSGVLEQTTPPKFNLLFKPGVLPPTSIIDTKQTCLVSVDMGGPNLSIEAVIREVDGDQTLKMVVQKSINHAQMREFFRVDATTTIISNSFKPEFHGTEGKKWSMKGKTIDISGSGILAVFDSRPPSDRIVRLDIALPTDTPETISVKAIPVRTTKVAEDHYEVAYHYDEIKMQERDRIIGCCLEIQRKMLRLKVRVRNPENL